MPITAIAWTKQAWTFDTLESAVLCINRSYPIHKLNRGILDTYWVSTTSGRQVSWGTGDSVIFHDEYGILIPVWKVKETYANIPYEIRNPPYKGWYSRYNHVKAEHYRRLPVPHVGKRNWRGDRHMRTLQEIRENDFLAYDEDAREYGIKCRPNRSRGYLRTYYDDVPHSDYGIKNWKKHREHQWKA